MERTPIRYIDLFAGCGGFSVGLFQAGLEGSFAIEKNFEAFETLKHNLIDTNNHFRWPSWLSLANWDIHDLLDKHKTELAQHYSGIDLVVGGPPCQGFSFAGRRIESDSRNSLVLAYLTFIEIVRPRALVFENVRGFATEFVANVGAGINYSSLVLTRLKELGYEDISAKVLAFDLFGVPQRRSRYIAIGTLSGNSQDIFESLQSNAASFLRSYGLPRRPSARTALSDLQYSHGTQICRDRKGFVSGKVGPATTTYQRFHRTRASTREPDSHSFVNHSPRISEALARVIASCPTHRSLDANDLRPNGIAKRSATVLDSNRPAPTLTTIPDDLIHYSEPRVLTVRECARLQSFPDWFEFRGQYTTGGPARSISTPRYSQVGNAVPPLFAHQLGVALTLHL